MCYYSSVVCEEPRQINFFSTIEHNTHNGTHNDHHHLPTFRATEILPPDSGWKKKKKRHRCLRTNPATHPRLISSHLPAPDSLHFSRACTLYSPSRRPLPWTWQIRYSRCALRLRSISFRTAGRRRRHPASRDISAKRTAAAHRRTRGWHLDLASGRQDKRRREGETGKHPI